MIDLIDHWIFIGIYNLDEFNKSKLQINNRKLFHKIRIIRLTLPYPEKHYPYISLILKHRCTAMLSITINS